MDKLIFDIFLVVIGFVGGFITAFGKGWVGEHFKKREEVRKDIEGFMGKVTDVVAVATSAGYVIRLNELDRRRMQRAAFQLERLGKNKLAHNIRSYISKWSEVYKITTSDRLFKGKEERRLELIKELDILTDFILKG